MNTTNLTAADILATAGIPPKENHFLTLVKNMIPPEWTAEFARAYGVVVTSTEGAVTIDEKMRNFTGGMSPVRQRGAYTGRAGHPLKVDEIVKALRQGAEGRESEV